MCEGLYVNERYYIQFGVNMHGWERVCFVFFGPVLFLKYLAPFNCLNRWLRVQTYHDR